MLTCPAEEADAIAARFPALGMRGGTRQAHLFVRGTGPFPPSCQVREPRLDELVLAYLRAPQASWLPGPSALERSA
jgi:hypothetical protein